MWFYNFPFRDAAAYVPTRTTDCEVLLAARANFFIIPLFRLSEKWNGSGKRPLIELFRAKRFNKKWLLQYIITLFENRGKKVISHVPFFQRTVFFQLVHSGRLTYLLVPSGLLYFERMDRHFRYQLYSSGLLITTGHG